MKEFSIIRIYLQKIILLNECFTRIMYWKEIPVQIQAKDSEWYHFWAA